MLIRPAVSADLDALVELGCAFRREVYADVIPENPAQMRRLAADLIAGDASTVLVAEDRGGLVVGMIGLLAAPHHLSGDIVAHEVFWYVDPRDRGSVGIRLLKAGEGWAQQHGVTTLHMVAPNPAVGAIYARLGYRLIEYAYARPVAHAHV